MFRSRSAASQTVYVLVVLVVLLGAAAAYGFARPTSGGTTTVTMSGTVTSTSMSTSASAAEDTLATAAQAECTSAVSTCLTILTTQDASNWANCYGPLFDNLYPWAAGKVSYVSDSTAQLTTTVISAYQAHNVQADVITGTLAGLIPTVAQGAVMNYTSPLVPFMNYTAGSYGPAWVTTNDAIVHMIYNPKVLAANNLPIPKNWSALADPIYKNWIAFQSGTSLGITTAEFYYLSTQMSNSSWTTLMQGIAANHPIITSTAGNAEQDVISGQAAIGIATFDDYVSDLKANASVPIMFNDIEPIVYTPGVVMITNGAPHLAMAELFEAFYISVPGQTGVLCTNHDPYMSSLSSNLLGYLPSDHRLVNAYANTALLTDSASWSDTFKTIFGA